MTTVQAVGAVSREAAEWYAIDWPTIHRNVRRLQVRIVKATKERRWGRVQALQRLLTHSYSGKVLAVRRVTENNGKATPGVDQEIWDTPEKKTQAVHALKPRGYRSQPLRRVYIPKSDGKTMRPLGIPTMIDRGQQALHLLVLDPVVETTADRNSYGFRQKRSCADAIGQCFLALRRASAQWILEGDIKSCFDKISHDWLLAHVARTIADEVKANVTPDVQSRLASARPVNPTAHEAYLRGKFFLNKMTEEGIRKAIEYAQEAIQIDPDYAPAYGLLAESYWMSSQNAFGHLPDAEAAGKTKVAAMKAIVIDDTLAEPHVALGDVLNFHEWDWAGSEREFKKAIELNPNSALAHGEYAWCLVNMGRQGESIGEAKRAVELDPFSEFAILTLVGMYYEGRQYDQALQHAQKWLEMFPNSPAAYVWLIRILEAMGMYEQEIAAWQREMMLGGEKPGDVAALRRAYNVGGIRGAWRWDLERLERLPPEENASLAIARHYASLGEKDEALDWLEKGYEEHAPGMAMIKVDPSYDSLRSNPRFQDLLRHMNFPP